MDDRDMSQSDQDYSTAMPLEISSDLASRIDDVLRDFAEDAELETALVVDRSGALVSGISSEEDVTVEVISALVAGASGAMRALVSQLGEQGELESVHFGSTRTVYSCEVAGRFVLVGVAAKGFPPGIVREKARQVRTGLAEMLLGIETPEIPLPPVLPVEEEKKSLRALHVEQSSERVDVRTAEDGPVELDAGVEAELSPEESDSFEFDADSDDLVDKDIPIEPEPPELEIEEVPEVPPEPKEIIEIIGLDDPEIVIEESTVSSAADLVDSPFEIEEEPEEESEIGVQDRSEDELSESIFEIEDEPVEDDSDSIFEIEDTEDDEVTDEVGEVIEEPEELIFEMDPEEESEDDEIISGNVFELDGTDEETEEFEEPEGAVEELHEESDSEAEEARPSGPRYF